MDRIRRRRSKAAKVAWIIISVTITALIAAAIWFIAQMQPLNTDQAKRQFIIEEGQSSREIARNLRDENFIKNDLVFLVVLKLSGKTIPIGTHQISSARNVTEIITDLQTATPDEVDVTILAGKTLADLKKDLLEVGFPETEIDRAFAKTYISPLLNDKPATADLEGYIFPDTYRLYKTDDLSILIQKSLDHLYEKLSSDGSLATIKEQGRTVYETLTLASIVQKEVSIPAEQKKVARVFENRLDAGIVLGSDVTFHYAYAQGLCAVNSPNCDSAYNTRIYAGLPPGPIANMEYAAIQAVLHPDNNNYYYFVAGDGEYAGQTFYARTEAEHNQNVANYCHELCN